MMSEGRKTQIVLLDEQKLEIIIQPRLYAGELLDIVSSHFNLKEKEYFGLSFRDETGHHHWLQLDRRVLEHDLPRKANPLVFYFTVRFFIETIGYLQDNATIELFYLHARQAIYNGSLECDSATAFLLGAHVLQASHGDYTDDPTAKQHCKKLPILPTSALQEHPSLTYCEEEVINHYKQLTGTARGTAIVQYMTIAEGLPTYGIHYYEVKDRTAIPWWLGLSHRGILLFDYADKKIPRRVFAWKQLENLYFRDKKFSIEVHDPKRIVHALSSFNLYEDAIQEPIDEFDDLSDAISDPTTQVSVSRRTFGPGNVNVHAWFTSSSTLTKSIWSMAVSQHQFYLDRKQSKSQLIQIRSLADMASQLARSSSSLHSSTGNTDISRSNSSHSLSTNNSKTNLSAEQMEASHAAQKDMYVALKARKDALQEALLKKTEELKALCIREGELTGELPVETPLAPGETPPQIRRRVGTTFTLSPKVVNRDQANAAEERLQRLELELELEQKITIAARRLAEDRCVSKGVHRQRKQAYHRAVAKLTLLEKRLAECRHYAGNPPAASVAKELSYTLRGSPVHPHHRPPPYPSDEAQLTIVTSPQVEVVEMQYGGSRRPPHGYQYTPASPVCQPRTPMSRDSTPSPCMSRRHISSRVDLNQRLPSRNESWPQMGWHHSDDLATGDAERLHNLYNLQSHSTCRYASTDELQDCDEMYQENGLPYDTPADVSLADLTPSRFGSKRESHAEHSDSPSAEYLDSSPVAGFMPGYTARAGASGYHQVRSNASTPEDGRPRQFRQQAPPHTEPTLAYQTSNTTLPYHRPDTTCQTSHSTLVYPSSHTPMSYQPSYTSLQAYPTAPYESETRPALTKYTSHVEVSKPFEMADFYKYSERLRRRRDCCQGSNESGGRVNESGGREVDGEQETWSGQYDNCELSSAAESSNADRYTDGDTSGGRLSLGTLIAPEAESVATAFSDEMLTWFGDQQAPQTSSTLV